MKSKRLKIAAALMLAGVPLAACSDGGSEVSEEKLKMSEADLSKEVVEAMYSEDFFVKSNMAEFEKGFEAGMKTQPGAAAVLREDPKLLPYLMERLKTYVEPKLREVYPDYVAKLAAALDKEMDKQQLAEAEAFFSSSTGEKFIKSAVSNTSVDYSKPDLDLTKEDIKLNTTGLTGELESWPKEDRDKLEAFLQSDAGKAFNKAGPAIQRTAIAWGNEFAKDQEAEMIKVVDKAAAEYKQGDAK